MMGLSLVEILVSLLLLSLLLLGTEAVQYIALRDTKTAYYVSVAHTQLNNMAERLRINLKQDPNDRNINQINEQISSWNAQNLLVLPQGKGTITQDGSLYVLSLFWGNQRDKNSEECYQNQIGPSGCLRLVIHSAINAA